MIQWMLAIWSLVSLPFLNPAWTSGSSQFTYTFSKPCLENFEHYFASVWDECNCAVVWTSFDVALLWDRNENWLVQSCGHCWVFQICWHIKCSTFTASSFMIWNKLKFYLKLTGIPSPPLAVFIVMLLRPAWLHIPGCLAPGEWSHHCGYLGHEDLFCIILLCILATSSHLQKQVIVYDVCRFGKQILLKSAPV